MEHPNVITVASKGAASSHHSKRMGIYQIVDGLARNDKPVWKMKGEGKEYVFYTGENAERLRYFYPIYI